MKKTLFFNLAKIQRKRDLGFHYLIPLPIKFPRSKFIRVGQTIVHYTFSPPTKV